MLLMHRLSALAAALLLGGCVSMAPPLERPASGLPAAFDTGPAAGARADADAGAAAGPNREDLGTEAAALDWRDYFDDPALQRLITQALAHNHDLRIAVLRVQEAQASLGLQRSARKPALGLAADASRTRTPADLSASGHASTGNRFQLALGISSWEIDFWGRIASLEEAALQSYLASDAARRGATLALVAEVADTWLGLRELGLRLRLAQDSAASQRESLRIFSRRFEVGAVSRLELTQVQTLRDQAESLVVQLEQQAEAQRHALQLLLGRAPEPSDLPLDPAAEGDWQLPPLRAGLPSDLLLHRPDIQAAEHQLRAAHATIGAARAAFFPNIGLTALGGTASSELDGLFRGGGRTWSFAPSLSLPIFDGGRNQANLDLAEVRRHLAVVQYEQAVQRAFRDVADALSARDGLARQEAVHRRTLDVQRERARLSRLSYDHGAASFLEVLDAERTLISAAQQLAQTRHSRLASQVALYRALGGGALQVAAAPEATVPSARPSATPATAQP